MGFVQLKMRLTCDEFWVDVRLTEFDGRWIASADTPSGPSLGRATSPLGATVEALAPFEGKVDTLLMTAPDELFADEDAPLP